MNSNTIHHHHMYCIKAGSSDWLLMKKPVLCDNPHKLDINHTLIYYSHELMNFPITLLIPTLASVISMHTHTLSYCDQTPLCKT